MSKRVPNWLLIAVMLLAALAAWLLHSLAPDGHTVGVTLPVSAAADRSLPPLQQYRLDRDQTELRDIAALEAILQNEQLEQTLRSDAAAALTSLVDARQRQLAMEGVLLESGFGPCTAVITGDQLTIVAAAEPSARDHAMLLELARIHAGIAPGNIRLVCGREAQEEP